MPFLTSAVFGFALAAPIGLTVVKPPLGKAADPGKSPQSFKTGQYRNLFREIGKSDQEICDKLNAAYGQLFYGDNATQRVFFPVGADLGYIKDVGNGDVRSEGMSYGMMIAVQLGQKEVFDRLWKWSKTYMQHQSGPWKGYFAWSCKESGEKNTKFPASDGEEYFITALYFAAGRWGSGKGIFDYRAEADAILFQLINKEKENGGLVDNAHNMFSLEHKQVVFVPNGDAAKFTDASYHLPAFYELWSRWGKTDKTFWKEAAQASRSYFKKAVHPVTGLASDYSTFDGKPMKAPWDPNSKGDIFAFDSFRVAHNIAMDHAWFDADPWQVQQTNRLLEFFDSQKPNYVSNYTVDGKPLVEFRSGGLVAMNAAACLAATTPASKRFIKDFWDAPIPAGQWRYYDGMLHLLGLLHCSGQYRIWAPESNSSS